MADYVSIDELKGHIQAAGGTFTASDDANLQIAIAAASEAVDLDFDTTFTSETATRYYTAGFSDWLPIDDLISVTSIKTDEDNDGTYEITMTTSDYRLMPVNARAGSNKRPYREIMIKDDATYTLPTGVDYGVEVIGSWGYAESPPASVKQAVLLIAHRLWARKDAIFGIAGTAGLGVTTVAAKLVQDSDVQYLLRNISRRGY